jgi:hypothetical protein
VSIPSLQCYISEKSTMSLLVLSIMIALPLRAAERQAFTHLVFLPLCNLFLVTMQRTKPISRCFTRIIASTNRSRLPLRYTFERENTRNRQRDVYCVKLYKEQPRTFSSWQYSTISSKIPEETEEMARDETVYIDC